MNERDENVNVNEQIRGLEAQSTETQNTEARSTDAQRAAMEPTVPQTGKSVYVEPRRTGAYNETADDARQRRTGDRLASGVIGALIGILVTLLVMVPVVFLTKDDSQSGDGQGENQQASVLDGVINEKKLEVILQYIDAYFLYDTDKEAFEEGIYDGIMGSLNDDYACYYNEEEFAELMESNEGSYYGIGVMVSQNIETMVITVSHVFRESPALEAGLKAGDVFVEVAGQNIQQLPVDDVVALIKGEEGSTVTIKVYRQSTEEYITMEVERRQVEQDMVYWNMMEDNIGYIQLIQFTGNAAEQLSQALTDLTSQGMEGVILDLRANPGGLLTSVVDVAELLLPEGNLLTIKSKYTSDRTYPIKASGFDYPLVVLVDGYSASASEVLTGAIQDYGVGTIVGTTTYGKGIVQDVIQLGDGTGIKFTTADYYTPSGRNIHGVGIEPDVYVELESEADEQLKKAVEVLKEKMNP